MEAPIPASVLYPAVQDYITRLSKEFEQIPEERKKVLNRLTTYIESKIKAGNAVQLTFICTHNSRRSHIAQIWAQTASYYFGMNQVYTYSGGTETTAFNARAVQAMSKAGFQITGNGNEDNPRYLVSFSDEVPPTQAYSKLYDGAENPKENFIAIMTCAQAEENCPFVAGADAKISLAYDDPKEFDGTPLEETKYDERTRQIGREIFYVFSTLNKL